MRTRRGDAGGGGGGGGGEGDAGDGGSGAIGPYRFATRIAVGGMAEVFRALRRQSAGADRAVVIKRMLPTLLTEPEWRSMFEHEARLGMRIRHPNVVSVIDHASDGEAPYLVLEYVFGVDLRRLSTFLGRGGRVVRPALAAWITGELLAGLHAVHSALGDRGEPLGIVHRDVSPSNVFLSVHGDVKLGDLGIARAAMRESPRTPAPREGFAGRPESAKGKLGYLSPEQVAGLPIDRRADVFAAATVLAELLIARPLFSGGTELGVLLAIRDADVEPLRAAAPRLPEGLPAVLERALARDPDRRTPDADALRRALAPFWAGEDEHALRAELGAMVVAALDAGDVEAGAVDRASLARTVERPLPTALEGEPARAPRIAPASPATALAPGDRARLFDLESPGASFGPRYEVHARDEVHGPWPYARVVQALRTAEIDAGARLRLEGDRDEPRPLAAFAEIARHLPRPSLTPPIARSTETPRATRGPAIAETSESWDLERGGLLPVLLDALRARETGLLLCERGGARKEVYLEGGVPAFVASNRVEELLGEHLVRERVVERSELELALAVMPRFEGRLGDTLVALGLVEPLALFRHIAAHAREKLLDVFAWSAGRAALYRHVDAPERSFPLRLAPWEILEEGTLRRIEVGLEPRSLARGRALVATGALEADDVPPPPHLVSLLARFARPRSIDEVIAESGEATTPDRVHARALVLLELGALRWAGP